MFFILSLIDKDFVSLSKLVSSRQVWRLCLRFYLHDGNIDAICEHPRHFKYIRNERFESVCDQWHPYDGNILPVPNRYVAILILLVQSSSEHNIYSGKCVRRSTIIFFFQQFNTLYIPSN